jgi:F-type H+-transporting ATPase subunit delta
VKAAPGVAKSYAKALLDLARERNQADAIDAELQRTAAIVGEAGELGAVLARPWVSHAVKQRIAEELGQRLELSKLGRDFLVLVAAHGRADHLGAIAGAYRALLDAERGRVRAHVRSAVALTERDRATLVDRLSRALEGKQVMLEEVVDSTLLGGFVAEIGSLLVDGSLDGQLARMRERLVKG